MKQPLLLLPGLLLATAALAHKPSDAYLTITAKSESIVTQRLDIALRDLDRELQIDADDDGQLSWGEVRSRATEIGARADQALGLQMHDDQGRSCKAAALEPLQLDAHSDGRYAVLIRHWQCEGAAQDLTLNYRLFAGTDPTHRLVMQLSAADGALQTKVLPPDGQAQHLSFKASPGQGLALGSVMWDGVHHIWIGYDHILFLLALLLPAVLRREQGQWQPAASLRPVLGEVLGLVSAFTLAHSVTLALAAFDVLNPPSRWIESLIAASVVLAALNNIWPVLDRGRWRLTLLFGLVHGFGFAGALKDLGLPRDALAAPLLMFNLGVELGQLAIVAAFMLMAWGLRRQPSYSRWQLQGGSAVIAALALVWLVERVFDWQLIGT